MQNRIFNCEVCNTQCIANYCEYHHDIKDYVKFMQICDCDYPYGLLCDKCERVFYKQDKQQHKEELKRIENEGN